MLTPVITKPTQEILEQTQHLAHPFCVVCSRAHGYGLGLSFKLRDDSNVEANFECNHNFQGYEGLLHGGIISSLLDGAMTNCLFAYGLVTVTAEMTVQFRHPVILGPSVTVRAHTTRLQAPVYVVEAEIVQEGQIRAKATGKFVERSKAIK